jgi:hypothetical protein
VPSVTSIRPIAAATKAPPRTAPQETPELKDSLRPTTNDRSAGVRSRDASMLCISNRPVGETAPMISVGKLYAVSIVRAPRTAPAARSQATRRRLCGERPETWCARPDNIGQASVDSVRAAPGAHRHVANDPARPHGRAGLLRCQCGRVHRGCSPPSALTSACMSSRYLRRQSMRTGGRSGRASLTPAVKTSRGVAADRS